MSESASDWETCGCPLCGAGADRSKLLHRFDRSAYHRCTRCELVYLSPRLTEGAMEQLYRSSDYWAGDRELGYETYEEEAHVYRRTFERRLQELTRFKTSGRLLDIGCGTGGFLDVATERGFDAFGLDVSEYAVASRRVDLGERVRVGSLETVHYESGFFDVVTMFDVFEHVYRPREFSVQLADILADDGVAVIATPNFDSLMRRLLGARSVSFKIPEHVCYYSEKTLALALGPQFEILHTQWIGQYCSVDFLSRRLGALSRPLGGSSRMLLPRGWTPYVPSGSLLAVFAKNADS